MREILFRGKKQANGQWVYGYLVPFTINTYGENFEIVTKDGFNYDELDGYAPSYTSAPVDPDTVGQFTGLTDRNGKMVFEGDILKIAKRCDSTGAYYHPPLDYPVNVVAKWDLCAWTWETLCEDKRYIGFPDAWCQYVCEVIGNIHDNPELMGGTENA